MYKEIYDATSFSFPFFDGGTLSMRLGELAIALGTGVNDANRRVFCGLVAPAAERKVAAVGVPGSEPLLRGSPSPAAASVRRNSTQRREKD